MNTKLKKVKGSGGTGEAARWGRLTEHLMHNLAIKVPHIQIKIIQIKISIYFKCRLPIIWFSRFLPELPNSNQFYVDYCHLAI